MLVNIKMVFHQPIEMPGGVRLNLINLEVKAKPGTKSKREFTVYGGGNASI